MFIDFLVGKWKWIIYVVKAHLCHGFIFLVCNVRIHHNKIKSLV